MNLDSALQPAQYESVLLWQLDLVADALPSKLR